MAPPPRRSWRAAGGEAIEVDGVWMSTGFAPANALLLQAGATMRYDTRLRQYLPETLPAGVYACGKVNGAYRLDDRLEMPRAYARPRAAG